MASQGHKSRITDLEWATQEAKITRLYWGEDKSLDEVMRIMERDVGFFARYPGITSERNLVGFG